MEQSVTKKPGFYSTHKTATIVIGVVILVVVVVGVLVLLWYLNVIMPRYHCVSGLCVKNEQGKADPPDSYSSKDCNNECPTKPPIITQGSFKCDTQKGCVGCNVKTDEGCTYTESSCDKHCVNYLLKETTGDPVTCQKQDLVTTSTATNKRNIRGRVTRLDPFYNQDQCTKALNTLTAKKCTGSKTTAVTGTPAFKCVLTAHTPNQCNNIIACSQCDENTNCKHFNSSIINTALDFTFGSNYFLKNVGQPEDLIYNHVLLWMGTYKALNDNSVLNVAPMTLMSKSSGKGQVVLSWLIFTEDYCLNKNTFPATQYNSSQGSDPTKISGGTWFTGKTNSNDVYNFIRSANNDTNANTRKRWGYFPDNGTLFSNWDNKVKLSYDLKIQIISDPNNPIQAFPLQKDKNYRICMYIGQNTTDAITVGPFNTAGAGSWGSLVESSWYDGLQQA